MNNKLLLPDLVQLLVEEGFDRAQADAFCRSLFSQIEQGVFAGETVKVQGLGNFKMQAVGARKSVDVTTGEQIEIKGHYKFSYTPDARFKEAVNRPFAHLETVDLPEQEEGPLFEVLDLDAVPTAEVQPFPQTPLCQPGIFETAEEEKPQEPICAEAEMDADNLPNADHLSAAPTTDNISEKAAENDTETPDLEVLPEKTESSAKNRDETSSEEETSTESAGSAEKSDNLSAAPTTDNVSEKTAENDAETVPDADTLSDSGQEERARRGLWWKILIGLLLLACVLYFLMHFFHPSFTKLQPAEPGISIEEPAIGSPESQPMLSDSLAVQPQDSITSSDSSALADESEDASTPISIPTSQPSEWPVQKTVVVERGDRLTLLAQNAYGDKIFWVYLFEANRDVLKNPNLLPAGATIKIPEIPASLLDLSQDLAKDHIYQLEEALKKEFD